MKKKRMSKRKARRLTIYMILVVLVIWSLAACSRGKKQDQNIPTQSPVVEDTKEPSVEEVQSTDHGKAVAFDEVMLVVGEQKVTYREVLIYLLQIKNKYEPILSSGIWAYQITEGTTIEDLAKQEVLSELIQIKIITSEAKKLDIVLTEDDMFEVNRETKEYLSKITLEDQEKYGITEDMVRTVLADNCLADKVFAVATNEVDTNISNEEAKQVRVEQIVVVTEGEDKNGTTVTMTPEQKEEALARANKMLEEVAVAEDFLSYAKNNSDLEQVSLVVGSQDKMEYGEAAMSMAEGEISNVIETSYGYVILKCISAYDEEATALRKEELIATKQNEAFQEKYKSWSSEYKITQSIDKWNRITFY